MERVSRLVIAFFVAMTLAWAQAPQSPELKQLQPDVGQWACSGETKVQPIDKYTGTVECAWDKGGKIMFCQQQSQWRSASTSFLAAWTYDTSAMAYTWVTLLSNGFPQVLSGSVRDGKKSFVRDGIWMGKPARYEFESTVSSDTFNYAWRRSVAGGPSILTEEAKCTRQK